MPLGSRAGSARNLLGEQAAALHRAGRLEDAEAAYRRLLREHPDDASVLALLGTIHLQRGDPAAGIGLLEHALSIDPQQPTALLNLALALSGTDRPGDALERFDVLLRLRPAAAAAHDGRGAVLRRLGRTTEALRCHERAIANDPNLAAAHNNRGIVLQDLDRHREASASYARAIALQPANADAHSNQGNALCVLGRPAEALSSCDRALALRPHHAQALIHRAHALRDLNRLEDAAAALERAATMLPGSFEAHIGLGNVLRMQGRTADALASCDRALLLQSDAAREADAHASRGAALLDLLRTDEALAAFDRAVALRPDHAGAHFNRALCLLLRGAFAEGWEAYEWRFRVGKEGATARAFAEPRWRGEPLNGGTLLVHAEQGLGDTIQFCRYLPLLAARAAATGGEVLVEVQPELRTLLGSLPGTGDGSGPGAIRILGQGDRPRFQRQIPLLSLPALLGTRPDAVLAEIPYLRADPARIAAWKARLAVPDPPGSELLVGLIWAGGTRVDQPHSSAVDRRRSMPLSRLAPLAGVPGVRFVSLQKGPPAAELSGPAPGLAPALAVEDHAEHLHDFSDTAALASALDLVISVDTAVAHLAGALGVPVWLLNRFDTCWRWGLDRGDSAWYPGMRLFRQPAPGDWASVIRDVCDALDTASTYSKVRSSNHRRNLSMGAPKAEVQQPEVSS